MSVLDRCAQVKDGLVGEPTLAKKHREEYEVVYLRFPPLPAQNGSLQENNLLGGQTSITATHGERERCKGKKS